MANKRYSDDPDKYRKKAREFSKKLKVTGNTFYSRHKKRILEEQARIRKEYPDKIKKIRDRWSDKNKDLIAYGVARYRTRKLKAVPKWQSQDGLKNFYKKCPNGMQVDHMVPLRSKFVCGLHCEANLQYLTPYENASKGNHWWPDMW